MKKAGGLPVYLMTVALCNFMHFDGRAITYWRREQFPWFVGQREHVAYNAPGPKFTQQPLALGVFQELQLQNI